MPGRVPVIPHVVCHAVFHASYSPYLPVLSRIRGPARGDGSQTHEVRCSARAYAVLNRRALDLPVSEQPIRIGDVLRVREWSPRQKVYTGRVLRLEVTHVLPGPAVGLEPGLLALSVTELPDTGDSCLDTVLHALHGAECILGDGCRCTPAAHRDRYRRAQQMVDGLPRSAQA
jgi:hypothetical protein